MPKSVRIIDEFLPAGYFATQKRDSANARYEKFRFHDLDYNGICRDESFDPAPLFARHGMHIRVQRQFFRIYEKDAVQNTYIHSDIGLAAYSAILSLAESHAHNGQLAFWRHKRTGWEEPDPRDQAGMTMIEADGLDEERWERTELVDLPPNRCVIFPATLYHSRYPRDWREPRPRRIEVFLFDLIDENRRRPANEID